MNLQISYRQACWVGGILTGVVLLVGVVIWSHRPGHRAGKIDRSPFETEVVEGFVRCLVLETNIRDAPICFLAFGEGNTSPSSGFLARFADCRHPAVRPVGSSVLPPGSRSFDKDNGRPGLVVHIIQCSPYYAGVFDITVSFSNLPPGRDRFVYRFGRDAGDWSIRKRTPS